MKYSLIIGTLNRSEQLAYCLESLGAQTYQNYEIIIIDQSDDYSTEEYINALQDNRIIYKHVDYKGLSKARNDGINIATGEGVCLIDDDAYYNNSYLAIANERMASNTILSSFILDTKTNQPFVKYKERYDNKRLPLKMVLKTCPSAGLILPMRLFKEIGLFDEKLGIGAEFPAGEETDLLLRAINAGYEVKYISDLQLKHPYPVPKEISNETYSATKLASYYRGIGALYKKHLFINHTKGMMGCYVELNAKLIIKQFFALKQNYSYAKAMRKEFKSGLKKYSAL